ncbi:hypothetical protein CAGGBEG34_240041 [Candidatus Glomeribacter gigasporarum BEG34]|uniref:Uncharacterized protein n=2 Tax=Candidatus Glomeribacter gigasporarum TaxID=132144 RepID=G2J9M3_9BURK|nr:hypothetical protein CAGGBEG34_240041 [Candidatus Glomeribacter gigasporarum BEG34]
MLSSCSCITDGVRFIYNEIQHGVQNFRAQNSVNEAQEIEAVATERFYNKPMITWKVVENARGFTQLRPEIEVQIPEGEKLWIKGYLPEDEADFVKLYTDQESMKDYQNGAWTPQRASDRFDQFLARFEGRRDTESGQYNALSGYGVYKEDGAYIGHVNLGDQNIPDTWEGEGLDAYREQTFLGTGAAGFKAYWDHGYGQAAGHAVEICLVYELLSGKAQREQPNTLKPQYDRILLTAHKDSPGRKILEALKFECISENAQVGYQEPRHVYLSPKIDQALYDTPIPVAKSGAERQAASTQTYSYQSLDSLRVV